MVRVGASFGTSVSKKLNVFAPWRRLVDLDPVVAAVACGIISPGMMWVNDILFVHGRLTPLDQQWVSAQFDLALAAAVGVMLAVVRRVEAADVPRFVQNRLVHWMLVVFAFALGASHVWGERNLISSVERRLGPNSLYHNIFLYLFLGYLFGLLFIATFILCVARGHEQPRIIMAYVAVMSLAICWAAAVVYDNRHQYAPGGIHKSSIANPSDPWCGGLLTRPLCGPPER